MSEQIRHVPDQDRWEAVEGEGEQARTIGFLSYELKDGVLDLQHTVVDPRKRGDGLGGRLVETAMQHARAEGLTVRPTCPFIPRYLQDHPEHQDLVEGARREGEGSDGG